VGNRYVAAWQGGQTENQGGQTKNFFRRFAPNFAHPGLKPCRRPWTRPTANFERDAVRRGRLIADNYRVLLVNFADIIVFIIVCLEVEV